jgi:MFS family permease
MRMLRLHTVWTTNLTGLLLGAGMYSSFVLIPEFVELPASGGVGFGSSVTQAGIFLLPSTLGILLVGPLAGRLSSSVGAKVPLVAGCFLTAAAYTFVAAAHDAPWQIYVCTAAMGAGIGFAFGAMANLIVAAVRPDETGIATGMNTIVRTIGGAIGSQVTAGIVTATVAANGLPTEEGFTIAFATAAAALAVGLVVAFAVPGRAAAADRRVAEAA